jgi:tripartite-type tricarboxylate transporter receptor subunit TctC
MSALVEGMMRTIMQRAFVDAIAAFLLLATAVPVLAQPIPVARPAESFPSGKPVEMTVMFGAGSAADVTARYLADGMARLLGVPVPVVNRTGGGGAIGYSHVKKQKPDGYSIIWN